VKKIIGISGIFVLLLIGYFVFNTKTSDFIYKHVLFTYNNSYGDNIYSVYKDKRVDSREVEYRNVIDTKINEILDNSYTLNYPLVIYNPYDDDKLSIGVYFNTSEDMKISYNVTTSNDDSYSSDKDNYNKNHAYIIKIFPGCRNVIELVGLNKDNEESKSIIFFDATNISK
jgi:hypothetical protein